MTRVYLVLWELAAAAACSLTISKAGAMNEQGFYIAIRAGRYCAPLSGKNQHGVSLKLFEARNLQISMHIQTDDLIEYEWCSVVCGGDVAAEEGEAYCEALQDKGVD